MLPFYNRKKKYLFLSMSYMYKITPRKITKYKISKAGSFRTEEQVKNEENLTRGDFKGEMSSKTRSKVTDMLNVWFSAVKLGNDRYSNNPKKYKPYLTFATLTLSSKQIHSDQEIKRKLLNSFIIHAQRNYNIRYYFWRAEAQANGNIHFHVIFDAYIKNQTLQKDWNKIQDTLGYMQRFKEKFPSVHPPSTHIVRVKDERGASCYITKYIGKKEDRRKIEGRIWGCSDELRQFKAFYSFETEELKTITEWFDSKQHVAKFKDEYFTIYLVDIQGYYKEKMLLTLWEYREHLLMLFDTFYMNDV